ncbi:MAG: ATP-binding protein, partial [Sutterella sp.]
SAAAEEARKSLRLPSSVIRLTLPGEALTAEANPLEIELIAVNLIRNAADAVADVDSPSISVSLTGSWNECCLTVSDNGPPVSDELFAAIVQQSARTTKEKGLGLGLSIIRSLTEDMGGHVVFSRSEGGGLAVAVILRRLRPENFS